jgi:hypothetical protein
MNGFLVWPTHSKLQTEFPLHSGHKTSNSVTPLLSRNLYFLLWATSLWLKWYCFNCMNLCNEWPIWTLWITIIQYYNFSIKAFMFKDFSIYTHSWRMSSSGILHCVALVRTDISKEYTASIIRVTRINELGTLAVTRNWSTLRRNTIAILWNVHSN